MFHVTIDGDYEGNGRKSVTTRSDDDFFMALMEAMKAHPFEHANCYVLAKLVATFDSFEYMVDDYNLMPEMRKHIEGLSEHARAILNGGKGPIKASA